MYLNDVEAGGGTEFKHLGLTTVPKAGRAVFWLNADLETLEQLDVTHHAALPVVSVLHFQRLRCDGCVATAALQRLRCDGCVAMVVLPRNEAHGRSVSRSALTPRRPGNDPAGIGREVGCQQVDPLG